LSGHFRAPRRELNLNIAEAAAPLGVGNWTLGMWENAAGATGAEWAINRRVRRQSDDIDDDDSANGAAGRT
jgi:hypothetical protein